MLDRPRYLPLVWAAACLVGFGLLTVLVTQDRAPLDPVDLWGRQAEAWADDIPWLVAALRVVEHLFATIGMTVLTAVTAVWLLWKKQPRAAAYTVVVMLVTSLVTTGVKLTVGRVRPAWQDSIDLLSTRSFPSGHASSMAAFAGVMVVLAWIFLRRSSARQAVYVAAAAFVVVGCLDRVLLGRHYPTDVIAGTLLGAGVALLALGLFDPQPRPQSRGDRPLLTTVPTDRQLAVVLNPSKVEDPGQFRSIVSAMAQEAGWGSPTWHSTTVEDPGTGMAHAAAVEGADLVIVCGGDGTVREVCAELAGTGIPVGIIPAGTGNLLARNLDIPLYIRSAIDVALNGQDRAVDLVAVSGDGFVRRRLGCPRRLRDPRPAQDSTYHHHRGSRDPDRREDGAARDPACLLVSAHAATVPAAPSPCHRALPAPQTAHPALRARTNRPPGTPCPHKPPTGHFVHATGPRSEDRGPVGVLLGRHTFCGTGSPVRMTSWPFAVCLAAEGTRSPSNSSH